MRSCRVFYRSILFMALCCFLFPKTGKAQLNENSIQSAHQYSASGAGLGMIVWEKGEIRFESYYNGHSAEKPIHIYSGTKSFFGVLAAIGVEEGWLNLDELVSDTITEWQGDQQKRKIIIRDLLNFTSGLESGASQIYSRTTADKLTLSLGLRVTAERGTSFIYGPSHLQVFCEVLRRKLAKKGISYEDYLRNKVIDPLGISITRWTKDDHGNVIPSAGMYITGRNWLSFGRMIAEGGKWNHRSIVDSDSLNLCFTGSQINPAYGLTFWLNAYAANSNARVADVEKWLDREPMPTDWRRVCLSKSAPSDLVAALGSNFQRLYVVPSQQLVVVHLGKKQGKFTDDKFLQLLFADSVVPKIKSKKTLFQFFKKKGKQ